VKGIIFNIVEEVVSDKYGEDTWDQLLAAAGLDGAYTSLGSYPDEELFRLVAAASEALSVPPGDVVRTLGEAAIPSLAERYPAFFAPHTSTKPFLLTLNDIIHPEVRKLYPGAQVPSFGFEDAGEDKLVIRYQSERKLCALAEGFILGAAAHYGELAAIEQSECMHRGNTECVLHCSFAPA
jgi:heme-NO-binding protein